MTLKLVSLFSGAGGLDRGFEKAGYEIVFSNEYDRTIWNTYRANFPDSYLDTRSITDIQNKDIPEADGLIGGPPCQSWSEAGAHRGITDERGQLFFEYIRVLKHVRPKFFLAENVSGILSTTHRAAFENIIERFSKAGYNVKYQLLNAADYGVPQDRHRVIVVGIRKDLKLDFQFPAPLKNKKDLRDAIGDLGKPVATNSLSATNTHVKFKNHEYLVGSFSSIFMSRNRVRNWKQQSFTIQAGARHAPIHPSAPVMQKIGVDKFEFAPGSEAKYRRMSVRECARIQTFPDSHRFIYTRIIDGYKMIGNAVPVDFAFHLAKQIKQTLCREIVNVQQNTISLKS
jgi:DNA (cytosine-5)-methyltransferase 1